MNSSSVDQVAKDLVMNLALTSKKTLKPKGGGKKPDGESGAGEAVTVPMDLDSDEEETEWQIDVVELENFLCEYDYFTPTRSSLDREKIELHTDFIKARSLYRDDIMIFPSSMAKRAGLKEAILTEATVDDGDDGEESPIVGEEYEPATPNADKDPKSAANIQARKLKKLQEAKCD